MKKYNNTTIQTPSIDINYSANGVELRIQGCKISCPTTDVAEATKSYYDGVNRSMTDSFTRMGIDITKVGSIFNQLLNFGEENLSKLLKVASEGVDELLEGGGEPTKETAASYAADHYASKPRVMLSFDRHFDPRLTPYGDKYGLTFEYVSEALDTLNDLAKGLGEVVVSIPSDKAELPLISGGTIIPYPEKGKNLRKRSIRWRIEKI